MCSLVTQTIVMVRTVSRSNFSHLFSEKSIEDGSRYILKYKALGKENTNSENPLEYALYKNIFFHQLPVGWMFG